MDKRDSDPSTRMSPPRLLEGVPISVKDSITQRGYSATCGTEVRCGIVHEQDSLLVTLVRDQGAIPFVRTNVPQVGGAFTSSVHSCKKCLETNPGAIQ